MILPQVHTFAFLNSMPFIVLPVFKHFFKFKINKSIIFYVTFFGIAKNYFDSRKLFFCITK